MKYIRTKDVIYEVTASSETNKLYENSNCYRVYDRENLCDKDICITDVIAKADTIDELCDGFVVISEEYDEPHYVKRLIDTNALDFENNWQPYGNGKVLDQTCQKLIGAIIYGAIWTKKGLIYVAKMNEKGKLKLL